jgi:hypothetical protein
MDARPLHPAATPAAPADRGLTVPADRITVTGPRVEQLFKLHAFQRTAVERGDRFTWNNWSRQSGKSFAFSLRRIIRGIACGRNQLFLSAGERQSRELMMKAAEHLRLLKRGFDLVERDIIEDVRYTAMEITIKNGPRILGLPANPRTARGFTGDVLLDEFYAAIYASVTRQRGELDMTYAPRRKGGPTSSIFSARIQPSLIPP